MNLPQRNSQFLDFTQRLLDHERAEHEAWLRNIAEYSKARQEWAAQERKDRQAAAAEMMNLTRDWDGSESDLVGVTNGEIGE